MIRAFLKLSKKDRTVISTFAVVIIAGLVVLIFNILNGTFSGADFPRSILQENGELQQYSRHSYVNLPIEIQFPGTDYGVCVGGTEIPAVEKGAAFAFKDDMILITAMMDRGVSTSEFISEYFPQILSGDDKAAPARFSEKISDIGYLNTYETEYLGGILDIEPREYVMTYKVILDGNVFLLGVATSDKYSLRAAFSELNHMFLGLCKYDVEVYEPPKAVSSDSVVVTMSEDSVTVRVDAPTIELYEGERYKTVEDVLESKARTDYAIQNPGATVIREQIDIAKGLSLETVAFSFEYVYGDVTPSEAILIDPSGAEYMPDYFNTNHDGRIEFVVEQPVYGTWTIEVSDDIELGEYHVDALRYMDYMDSIRDTETQVDSIDTLRVSEGVVRDYVTGAPIFPIQSEQ